MHKTANNNPDETIFFDFIDDNLNILNALKNFFEQAPQLIPQNVTLRTFIYAHRNFESQALIKGNGIIDANYRATVMDMSRSVKEKMQISAEAVGSTEIDIAANLDLGALVSRRAFAPPTTLNPHRLFAPPAESEPKQQCNPALLEL